MCLCGSTDCHDCGPAQGANPDLEAFHERLLRSIPWLIPQDERMLSDLSAFLHQEVQAEQERCLDVIAHFTRPRRTIRKGALPPLASSMNGLNLAKLLISRIRGW
jgi:hypothetical protein